MYKLYPNFKDVHEYWKLNDFDIVSSALNDKTVTVIGRSENFEVLFEVEKIEGKYIITKSKGLSSDFNSNLYKFCKNIGCIGLRNYDVEISKICKENKLKFNQLVKTIKNKIEENVIIENHTVRKQYDWASGDITFKNFSRFTIPEYVYKLYVEYSDNNGNILFTSEDIENYKSIPFGQSRTISVLELNIPSFKKIGVKLNITNTTFIEEIIGEYAEGKNCEYSDNL
jgi:hypothetical protein